MPREMSSEKVPSAKRVKCSRWCAVRRVNENIEVSRNSDENQRSSAEDRRFSSTAFIFLLFLTASLSILRRADILKPNIDALVYSMFLSLLHLWYRWARTAYPVIAQNISSQVHYIDIYPNIRCHHSRVSGLVWNQKSQKNGRNLPAWRCCRALSN